MRILVAEDDADLNEIIVKKLCAEGYAPYEELEKESFEDNSVRQLKVGGDTYLIYDWLIEIKRHDDVWVRGVVSERGGAISVSTVSRAALIVPRLGLRNFTVAVFMWKASLKRAIHL